jgi:hypothetical protein
VADPLDLLALDEAKRPLNIRDSDTLSDIELAEVITAASQFIDDLCGPVIIRPAPTLTVLEPCGPLFLPVPPGSPTFGVTFTSVTEYSSGVATVLTAEDIDTAGTYRYDPHIGCLRRRSSWSSTSWGLQEVVVEYTAGRFDDTSAVSQKFKSACRKVLVHRWQGRGAGSGAAAVGEDGPSFGAIPYSPAKLVEHLAVDLKNEVLLDSLVTLA